METVSLSSVNVVVGQFNDSISILIISGSEIVFRGIILDSSGCAFAQRTRGAASHGRLSTVTLSECEHFIIDQLSDYNPGPDASAPAYRSPPLGNPWCKKAPVAQWFSLQSKDRRFDSQLEGPEGRWASVSVNADL